MFSVPFLGAGARQGSGLRAGFGAGGGTGGVGVGEAAVMRGSGRRDDMDPLRSSRGARSILPNPGGRPHGARPPKETPMQRKWIAEALGTAWLVIGGCGTAVLAGMAVSVAIIVSRMG